MKSLVALLDRRKRPNTLIPAPLPSSLSPTVSAPQERLVPPPGSRHTLSPDFLRPPVSHRATSNPNLAPRPHIHEPVMHPRRKSPVQSIVYHNDPDDDTLADPFAASSPLKSKFAPLPTSFRSVSAPARRGSSPNLATPALQDAFQNPQPVWDTRDERSSSFALRIASQAQSQTGASSNETVSAPVHDVPGKGRWLRERRSLSNFLRPQVAVSTRPAPQFPPFPAIPERKGSFFKRGRSGSTPAASHEAERAHTSHLSSTTSAPPIQPQLLAASPLRIANRETARPPTPSPATPESWARASGVGRDQSSPSTLTNARRRALSAPARPPRPTEPAPPVPVPQLVPSVRPSESNASKVALNQVSPVPRPGILGDRQARAHAIGSGSTPVSNSHDPGCTFGSNLRRRPSLKHVKQLSISVSEGGHGVDSASSAGRIVRKSALRRTSAQARHGSHTRQDSRVAVAEGPVAVGTASVSQLPTPHQGVSDMPPKADVTERRRPVGGILHIAPLAIRANDRSIGGPGIPPSVSDASLVGNISGGHSLAPSDSRALPVLDNVWGSFVSETACGSLPSSPSGSIAVGNRAEHLPGPAPRRQTIECPRSPESPRGLPRRRQWNSALSPPSSPPAVKLPPIPIEQSPAMALSFGSVIRRKLSRCPSKRETLLTPPVSPPEETKIHMLGVTPSPSTSGNSLLASSCNSSIVSAMGSRDLPPLMRSAPSPIMQSPASPVLGAASDTSDRSWLSVDSPRLRSIPPSTSQSGSQSTPIPGTPISSPISAGDLGSTNLGTSSDMSGSALSMSLGESTHVGVSDESVQKAGLRLSPPSVPVEGSEISLSMFPAVPMGIPGPYGRREVNRKAERGETLSPDWSEESLPTPPVTPAWFAQAFDTSAGNERECVDVGGTG
ncbi:hypothetical protein FRC10_005600 [Ceratobasidium sp. 414]|nr:hypothetical protein FRC10_005600 [Ceratobasidium sp. 414]